MSDAVLDIESAEQNDAPRRLITITHGKTTYRLTTSTRNVSYGGALYRAAAAGHGSVGVAGVGDPEKDVTITLPIDHAFVRRYVLQGVPPRKITATIISYYSDSVAEQVWSGEITSMAVDDRNTEATFRVPSRIGRALVRKLPTITAGRTCPHMLYDATCAKLRTGSSPSGVPYKCTTTVIAVNGRDVRLDLHNVPVGDSYRLDWLVNGELVHVASGENMTIRDQNDVSPGVSTVTDVSMHLQIPVMRVGDSIELYAGCSWDLTTCDLKFDNLSKYGGDPYMPTGNPYVPGSGFEEE